MSKTIEDLEKEVANLRKQAMDHRRKVTESDGFSRINDNPLIQQKSEQGRIRGLLNDMVLYSEQAAVLEALIKQKRGGR